MFVFINKYFNSCFR